MGQIKEHIIVNTDRSISVPESIRRIAIEQDHDMETFIFDCPRYWDEHDMSTDQWKVHINYMLPNGRFGTYCAEDVGVDITDKSIMHFRWPIKEEMTQIVGTLTFMICIRNLDDTGKELRHWNTESNDEMYISDGLEPSPDVVLPTADLVTQMLIKLDIIDEMIDELNGVLGGVVSVIPNTVPMRDGDGYLYTKTPDNASAVDAAANKEYVDNLRSDMNTYVDSMSKRISSSIDEVRGEYSNADNLVRGEFTAADTVVLDTARSDMKNADDTVLSTIRDEMKDADDVVMSAMRREFAAADAAILNKIDGLLSFSYGKTDLTPGFSELATGTVYFMYEETLAFSIGGVVYSFESGMTWQEWVNSAAYNTDEYWIASNGKVFSKGGECVRDVESTDELIVRTAYTLIEPITFHIGSDSYQALSGMSWSDLVQEEWASMYSFDYVTKSNVGVLSRDECFIVCYPDGNPVGIADTIDPNVNYQETAVPITFTIDGTSYAATGGMTWQEWVNSENNVEDANGYKIVVNTSYGRHVMKQRATATVGSYLQLDGSTAFVHADDTIIGGAAYKSVSSPGA